MSAVGSELGDGPPAYWIATVHIHLDVTGATEDEARAKIRQQVAAMGGRLSYSSPGHSVDGVLLSVPLSERLRLRREREAAQS